VIAICATRTGVGKSQTTRYVAKYLKELGKKIAVVRHPMPYDQVLLRQRCQRYEVLEDMDKYDCTIEEREEYELHIQEGNLLFAGVDYEMILREAEKEADGKSSSVSRDVSCRTLLYPLLTLFTFSLCLCLSSSASFPNITSHSLGRRQQ
jgi:predicted GTPase